MVSRRVDCEVSSFNAAFLSIRGRLLGGTYMMVYAACRSRPFCRNIVAASEATANRITPMP